MTDQFFEQAELQATDTDLRSISDLMMAEDQLQRAKETQEALLSDINERLRELKTKTLPDAMMAAGVDKFRCSETGTEAKIALECSGALGSDEAERERKIELLIGAGAGEIVKTLVVAAFGKDDYEKAQALAGELNRRKLPVVLQRTIHPQTLKSWVKERMEDGATLPLDECGLWYGNVAKIKRPKDNDGQ